MKNISKIAGTVGLALVVLSYGIIMILPNSVEAKVSPVEGVSYNVDASLEDNLKSLVGKKVQVTIDSGSTITGLVKKVGKHLIHIEKLDGKEFFDALIRIKNINAISTRFREIKR